MIHSNLIRDLSGVMMSFDAFYSPGSCAEVRLFRARRDFRSNYIVPASLSRTTISGYFDNGMVLARALLPVRGVSAYITVNPVKSLLMSRIHNRLDVQSHATRDEDIERIDAVLVDIDSIRPPDISATLTEYQSTLVIAKNLFEAHPEIYQASQIGCSGNGTWVRVKLFPGATANQCREFLQYLQKFNNANAKIDDKTWNPARVMACPGTWKCKGENTSERPYRLVTIEKSHAESLLDLNAFLAIHRPEMKSKSHRDRNAWSNDSRDNSHYAEKCLNDEAKNVSRAPVGERNQQLNKSAFSIGTLIGAGILDRGKAETILHLSAQACGLSDGEIRSTLQSGIESGIKNPRDLRKIEEERRAYHNSNGQNKQTNHSSNHVSIQQTQGFEKPKIYVGPDENRVNDEAIEALGSESELYTRSGMLVWVRSESIENIPLARLFATGTPRIEPIVAANLREMLSRAAEWIGWKETKDGLVEVPIHPPKWSVDAILARGQWPRIRHLNAIAPCPMLRPDGTFINEPGYDSSTGLLCLAHFQPNIPEKPTFDQAKKAAERLINLACDFPFAEESDKSAWLALGLTMIARFAILGPCPQFFFNSNVSGTGKSKLAAAWLTVVNGVVPRPTPMSENNEEFRKIVLSLLIRGLNYIWFDNQENGGIIGGNVMDAVLTSTVWGDRVLGISKVADLPSYAIWIITGNNIGIKGDLHRRTIPINLNSQLESPESRTNFTFPDFENHIQESRREIISDLLTILVAHAQAGLPSPPPKLGSYPDWERVVRGALTWMGFADPCTSIETLRSDSTETTLAAQLIHGFGQLPNAISGLTINEAVDIVNRSTGYDMFRSAITSMGRNGQPANSALLGRKFSAIKDVIVDGAKLISTSKRDQARVWKFVRVTETAKQPHSVDLIEDSNSAKNFPIDFGEFSVPAF